MKKVSLIGAGGHCRSIIALLQNNAYEIEYIFDDGFKSKEMILGIPLVGDSKSIETGHKLVLAIGDNQSRHKYFSTYGSQVIAEAIIHPTAFLEKHVKLGTANNIFAKVFINNAVFIGDNNLINSAAILEHEVIVGSHNHISISACLLGRSQIGDRCFIGAGAIIKEKVKICSDVTIGANSFVAEDITLPGVYVGSPARKIK